jgi:acylphosphatase
MRRVQVLYLGRVQGVGFRVTCRALAAGFAVTGWVRNQPDGSVLLEAQGAASEVESLLTAVRERMGRNIQSEQRLEVALDADEQSFVIRG